MQTFVFHHGALGDTVLTWPLLRAMGEAVFIAPPGKAKLTARWIDGVAPLDGDSAAFSRLFAPAAERDLDDDTLHRLGAAERIVSFVSDGHDAWAANLWRIAERALIIIVNPKPPNGAGRHVVAYHRDQLADQGLPLTVEPVPPRDAPADGPVVIHPGSGALRKCWDTERFAELIEHLQADGRRVVLLLGEAERYRWPDKLLAKWRKQYELREPDSLIELAEVIAGASLYIGNDSGPTHLAAQLGLPTIAMYGPTDPVVWAPVGPQVKTLAPPAPSPMTWLDVETVTNAVGATRSSGSRP